MSLDRVTNTLETFLRTVLWTIAFSVIGISAAIMLTMDQSSASQGGRFYVAVIAIVLLGAVDHQLRRLMRRRLPFSLTTLPEERRYNRHSLLLLTLASALLLGLAVYLTVGMSKELLRIGGYLLALATGPFLVAYLLQRFVKKPFERGIDMLFGEHDATRSTSRTFTFSFGTPPPRSMNLESAWRVPPGPVLPAGSMQRYHRAWEQIRTRFGNDPAQAVRDAHHLILELCAETGHAGALVFDEQFVLSDLSGAASSLRSMGERVRNAREAGRAIRSALAHESASPTDLAKAMVEYERILMHLLARNGHGDGFGTSLQP